MVCNGLQLPTGCVYLNEINLKNNVMSIDISDYDDFILECSSLFKNYKEVERIIYKDTTTSFILTKDDYNKINKILEVSSDYDIDFFHDNPFEEFGSDEESEYMSSFSKYYKEILNDFPIEYIETKEKSDGKYIMEIHPTSGNSIVIDLCAWDKLEVVIDNIETIKEKLQKETDIGIEV